MSATGASIRHASPVRGISNPPYTSTKNLGARFSQPKYPIKSWVNETQRLTLYCLHHDIFGVALRLLPFVELNAMLRNIEYSLSVLRQKTRLIAGTCPLCGSLNVPWLKNLVCFGDSIPTVLN